MHVQWSATLLVLAALADVSLGQTDWGDPFVTVTPEGQAVCIEATADTLKVPETVPGVFEAPFVIGTLAVDTGT